ncbi:FAD/NAD(P)-binding protein [Patulibacter sp. SYSU D01012]|uniref:NAD(P)-binding protein n=1 Tax=Patulibacter sp. SYSU D01012 TaxID=2817381 RepID=UPI001B314CEC
MPDPHVVVGGTWTALVAADRLAAAGRPVRLLLPDHGVGGGFASRRLHGRTLELGLRTLELDHEAAPTAADAPPLETYDVATGHVPHLAAVKAYVAGLAGDSLVPFGASCTAVGGRLVDDLFVTADPMGVRAGLTRDERRAAAAQLGGRDGAGVLAGPLGTTTLHEASLHNHGPLVHARLIAPFVEKVVAGGDARVLAAFRRRVWTPLLWPRSVREACGDGPFSFRPERPQHAIRGGVGRLVDAVVARLQAQPLVTIERPGALRSLRAAPEGGVALGFAAGDVLVVPRPVLATSAAELFAAAGIGYAPERARTVVAWCEVPEDDLLELPAVTHVVDADVPALRVTTGGAGAPEGHRLLCVELRHDADPEDAPALVRRSLERTGILREGGTVAPIDAIAAKTFPVPTRRTVEGFAEAAARLDALGLDVEVVGPGCGLPGDYLNEQIAAGLACAARHGAAVPLAAA